MRGRLASIAAGLALLALATGPGARAQSSQGAQDQGQVQPDERARYAPRLRPQRGVDLGEQTEAQGGSPDESALDLYSLQPGSMFSLAGPVDPDVYRVGPGDLLLLQMWGKVARSVPVEVGPEGTALIPGVALVKVAGRTLTDVRNDLLERLRKQYRGVSIDLRLARARVFRVYLTGRVRFPGPVEGSGALRVGDVLTPGQFLEDAARRRIEVLHRDGTRETADLGLFFQTGDASLNPWLRDGDVIQVPNADEFVWVEGAMAIPGRVELGLHDSLRTVLRMAGDPLPAAELSHVLLIQFPTPFEADSLWLNLEDVYGRRNNPPVVDGERIYVYFLPQYHQQAEAEIMGEVNRPGDYPIVEGRTRLSDLVASADGFLATADLSAIRVHRQATTTTKKDPNAPAAEEKDPELDRLLRLSRNDLTSTEYGVLMTKLAGKREDYRVDWNRLKTNPDLDLLLRDGDIVRVERLVSSIRVDGEVRRPGILNFVRGTSVEEYVAQAGGFTDRAWRGKVRVTRSVTGQTLLARNVRTLDPGDFVWVPEKPDRTSWEQAKDVITALASIATVIIAIRSLR